MRILLSILASICFIGTIQGQDLSGNWKGYFVPNNETEGRVYNYELEIKENANHQLSVTTLTHFLKNYSAKATAAGIHTIATNQVSINETRFENLKLEDNFLACLMTNFLEYSNIRDHEMLQGTYISNSARTGKDCGGGTVYLEKTMNFENWATSKKIVEKKTNPTIPPKTEKKPTVKVIDNGIAKIKSPTISSTTKGITTSRQSPPLINASNSSVVKVVKNANDKNDITNQKVVKYNQVADQTAAITKSAIDNGNNHNQLDEVITQNVTVDSEKKQAANFQIIPWVLVGRENKLVKKIITHNKKISIDLYDNGTIDNDTIMVYDNKQLIVANKRLSYKAIHIDLSFSESNNEHEIIIVAQNMGTVPPNTALLVLKDGDLRQEYFITSTNKMNAKLIIDYQPLINPAKPGQQ